MYSYIKGELSEIVAENHIVVENGGIGYNIYIPGQVLSLLPEEELLAIKTKKTLATDEVEGKKKRNLPDGHRISSRSSVGRILMKIW